MKISYPLSNRVFAMSEVLAVFFGGSLIAQILFKLAGVTSHPLIALTKENPDMFAIAVNLTTLLLLQFVGWFVLIIFFCLLNQQKLKRELKLSLSGQKALRLIGIGILAWCVGDIFNKVVFLADQTFGLGVSVPWREALLNGEKTLGWWLVMFVGSFGLIPVLEEVLWRGYIQSKLIRFFSPSVGIVITAGLFVFSHAQYHQFDLYHGATIVALFASALVLGVVTYKTNSIVPAIVMHTLLNFPISGIALAVALAAMVIISVSQFKRVKLYFTGITLAQVGENFSSANIAFMLVGILTMLTLSQAPHLITLVAGCCLFLAVISALFNTIKKLRKLS